VHLHSIAKQNISSTTRLGSCPPSTGGLQKTVTSPSTLLCLVLPFPNRVSTKLHKQTREKCVTGKACFSRASNHCATHKHAEIRQSGIGGEHWMCFTGFSTADGGEGFTTENTLGNNRLFSF